MESKREEAIRHLRYGAGLYGPGGVTTAYPPGYAYPDARTLTADELAHIEAEHRKYSINHNRRDMLATTLALGRRYEGVDDVIADARTIAKFLNVEID